MRENWEFTVSQTLRYEGSVYTNDPLDPGGPTKYGITLTDYQLYIDKNGTAESVKNLTIGQAKEIYRLHYWNDVHGDELLSPFDFMIFDFGVNSGVEISVKAAQAIVGVTEDGKVGPKTIAAVNAHDPLDFIEKFHAARMERYRSRPAWPRFGGGWTTRANTVKMLAKARVETKRLEPAPSVEFSSVTVTSSGE
jgi:lysozyme family protein